MSCSLLMPQANSSCVESLGSRAQQPKLLASWSMVWRQELQLVKERRVPQLLSTLNVLERQKLCLAHQTHPVNEVTGTTLLLCKKATRMTLFVTVLLRECRLCYSGGNQEPGQE